MIYINKQKKNNSSYVEELIRKGKESMESGDKSLKNTKIFEMGR